MNVAYCTGKGSSRPSASRRALTTLHVAALLAADPRRVGAELAHEQEHEHGREEQDGDRRRDPAPDVPGHGRSGAAT